MNIALTKIDAYAGARRRLAGSCVRALMLCCSLSLTLSCALASGAVRAHQAGPEGREREAVAARVQQQAEKRERNAERGELAQQRGNELRAPDAHDETRRTLLTQPELGGRGRNARLTPDQRRDLRRQINAAGQDLYSRPRR